MSDNVVTRIYRLLIGAFMVLIGVLGSHVGIAFLGVQLFGDVEFEMVAFLIGAFSMIAAPPAIFAGARLMLNKPNDSGGLLSPFVLRVFAVSCAILGALSVWVAHEKHLALSVFATVILAIVIQQAFSLANRREKARNTRHTGFLRNKKHAARHSPSHAPRESFDSLPRGETRASDHPFDYVHVNEDGTVREVSPSERAYLSEEFELFDGGRPYVKDNLDSLDGWDGRSGFLERRKVPPEISIEPVNPDYDAQYEALMWSRSRDPFADHREASDIIEPDKDGSMRFSPNPHVPHKERFEKLRQFKIRQRREEDRLAKYSD